MMTQFVANPGRVARKHSGALAAYKAFANLAVNGRRRRLRDLASTFPAPSADLRVPGSAGFKVVPPGQITSAAPLIALCRRLTSLSAHKVSKKSQLHSLVGVQQVAEFHEFLDFCLDPMILGVGADYLGELPILASVEFWHSTATDAEFANSQLYHCDLDDFRQFKVFLFVSDVDIDCGPLTLLPGNVSDRVRRTLRYRPSSGNVRIADERIRPLLSPDDEQVLLGPSGTIVFVDTSRLLHFGSRVSSRDRYVVMVQYLTLTNFMRNPLYSFEAWPYAHLAQPHFNPAQRAVLGEGVVTTINRTKARPT